MACPNNVKKGGEIVLLARNDGDTVWEIVGGVESVSESNQPQTAGSTSSSTIGDVMENAFTGYREVSITITGKSDKTTGTDPVTGLAIVGSRRLVDISNRSDACGKFQLQDTDTGGTITGFFIVGVDREIPKTDLVSWTATLTHKSGFTRVGDI